MNKIIFVNRLDIIRQIKNVNSSPIMGEELQFENTLIVYIDTIAQNSRQYHTVRDCLLKHVPSGALATKNSPIIMVTGNNDGLCIDVLEQIINKVLQEHNAIFSCMRIKEYALRTFCIGQ